MLCIVCCSEAQRFTITGATWPAQEEAILWLCPASVDPCGYFLPLVFYERWDDCRPPGVDGMPLPPGGRQQLESSGGLRAQRGKIQLFRGQRWRWPLALWRFSFSVNGCPISQITCVFTALLLGSTHKAQIQEKTSKGTWHPSISMFSIIAVMGVMMVLNLRAHSCVITEKP